MIIINEFHNTSKFSNKKFNSIRDLVRGIEKDTEYDVLNWDDTSVDLIPRDGWHGDEDVFTLKVTKDKGKYSIVL